MAPQASRRELQRADLMGFDSNGALFIIDPPLGDSNNELRVHRYPETHKLNKSRIREPTSHNSPRPTQPNARAAELKARLLCQREAKDNQKNDKAISNDKIGVDINAPDRIEMVLSSSTEDVRRQSQNSSNLSASSFPSSNERDRREEENVATPLKSARTISGADQSSNLLCKPHQHSLDRMHEASSASKVVHCPQQRSDVLVERAVIGQGVNSKQVHKTSTKPRLLPTSNTVEDRLSADIEDLISPFRDRIPEAAQKSNHGVSEPLPGSKNEAPTEHPSQSKEEKLWLKATGFYDAAYRANRLARLQRKEQLVTELEKLEEEDRVAIASYLNTPGDLRNIPITSDGHARDQAQDQAHPKIEESTLPKSWTACHLDAQPSGQNKPKDSACGMSKPQDRDHALRKTTSEGNLESPSYQKLSDRNSKARTEQKRPYHSREDEGSYDRGDRRRPASPPLPRTASRHDDGYRRNSVIHAYYPHDRRSASPRRSGQIRNYYGKQYDPNRNFRQQTGRDGDDGWYTSRGGR